MASIFDEGQVRARPSAPRVAQFASRRTAKAASVAVLVLDGLSPADRRLVEKMAADAAVPPAAMAVEVVAAYLRLLREVPAALPRDPMRGLSIGAARRARAGGAA